MPSKKNNKGYLKGCGIALLVVISLFFMLFGIGFIAVLLEDPNDYDQTVELSEDKEYEKALTLYGTQEYIKANEEIDTLIAEDSMNPPLLFLKGKIVFELGDTIASRQYMDQAIAFTDSIHLKFDIHNAVFNWNIDKRDTMQAASILIKTLPLFKQDDYKKYINTHYNVANIFDRIKMTDKSVIVLNTLIDSISIKEIDTISYQKVHYSVYDKLLRLKDTIKALHTLEKVTKEIGSSRIAYEKLGNFYRKKSQNKKAIKYYKNYLKVDTTNAVVYTNLGKSYRDIKYKKSAIKYFKIATRKGNSEACYELRELTARTKYYTESICCDGSRSSSTGRGTCSHHGGVCGVEYIPYKDYTMSCRN